MREGIKQSKHIEKPQDHRDDDNAVQDGLNRSLHRDETIDQPEQNTDNNQDHNYLQQRHKRYLLALRAAPICFKGNGMQMNRCRLYIE
jgi:hypothetical protein